MPFMSGVYQITNTENGKFYIGSSQAIKNRWNQHRSLLRRGFHPNPKLQHAWNKYGEPNFSFKLLEVVELDRLIQVEQQWIDKTKCYDRKIGYNISQCAEAPMRGRKATLETRALQSANMKGKKRVFHNKEQWRSSIKKSWVGRTIPADQQRRMAEARIGKKRPTVGVKISAALKGRKPSESQVNNIIKYNEKRRGEGPPIRTREHRDRLSASLKGRPKPKANCPQCNKEIAVIMISRHLAGKDCVA